MRMSISPIVGIGGYFLSIEFSPSGPLGASGGKEALAGGMQPQMEVTMAFSGLQGELQTKTRHFTCGLLKLTEKIITLWV